MMDMKFPLTRPGREESEGGSGPLSSRRSQALAVTCALHNSKVTDLRCTRTSGRKAGAKSCINKAKV